ncbi:HNH endonuclease family protein [Streptomyces sp. NPDC046870]|uniref:HNH endonuclease family protein n=1 Tax=Streptomyces sp. NPDC046870 TaxID=3155135 RepID=UPI003454185E
MHPFHAKLALLTAAVAALLAPVNSAPAAAAAAAVPTSHVADAPSVRRDLPEPPPADAVRKELGELTVAAPHPMTGYSRSKFPHWITQYGTCDTREVVLARDGQDVVQDDQCRAVSGIWYSAYDGKIATKPSTEVDIDHVVPLANGWRSGADEWTTAKRRQFANDLVNPQLIAVSASSNRQKGDQSPDQWAPPLRSYWCTYARAWTHVKYVYDLNITEPEKDKLTEMLDTCPA